MINDQQGILNKEKIICSAEGAVKKNFLRVL